MNEELMKQVKSLIEENKEWDAIFLIKKEVHNLSESELISLIQTFPIDRYRINLIEEYSSPNEREKYIDYVNDVDKVDIISDLSKDKQLKYKSLLEKILKKEDNDFIKVTMLTFDGLSEELIMPLINTIKTTDYKMGVIHKLSDKNKLKYIIENYSYPYNSKEIYEIIKFIKDENILSVLLFTMRVLNKEELRQFRMEAKVSDDFIRRNFMKFIELESNDVNDIENRKKVMSKVIDDLTTNNLRNINVDIFSSKIIGKTHLDELNVFLQQTVRGLAYTDAILDLSEKEQNVLLMLIEHHKHTTSSINYGAFALFILNNLETGQYSELINSIENVSNLDLNTREKLYKILQNDNIFELKNISDIHNYESIKEKKCDELIKGNLEDKKNAIFMKLFGQNLEFSEELSKQYSEYNKFNNTFLKNYLSFINLIINTKDEQLLLEIYNSSKIMLVDKAFIENQIELEYAKMFNKNLFIPSEKNIISKEQNIYDAGTDFNMIVSVIGGSDQHHSTEDYYKDWNREKGGSNMFCASYIRYNCWGTILGIYNVTFGFNSLEPSTMVGCYWHDAGTRSNGLSTAVTKAYMSPDSVVKNTALGSDCWYNEINYLRYNNDVRQQPDYLVAFSINGNVKNKNDLLRAQEQFNNIPIVVVDVNKCVEKAKQEVIKMINKYEKTQDDTLKQNIYLEITRNRVLCNHFSLDAFLENIDINKYKTSNNNSNIREEIEELELLKGDINEMRKYLEIEEEQAEKSL